MEDDSPNLVPRGQVNRRHGSDALPVEDDVFRWNAVLGTERVPRTLNVGVKILFRGFAGAGPVPGVVVTEDIAVDSVVLKKKQTIKVKKTVSVKK